PPGGQSDGRVPGPSFLYSRRGRTVGSRPSGSKCRGAGGARGRMSSQGRMSVAEGTKPDLPWRHQSLQRAASEPSDTWGYEFAPSPAGHVLAVSFARPRRHGHVPVSRTCAKTRLTVSSAAGVTVPAAVWQAVPFASRIVVDTSASGKWYALISAP